MVENCLTNNHIDCAKYHGGQLEGKTVICLFQNAGKIFGDMKEWLITAPSKAYDEDEINDWNAF